MDIAMATGVKVRGIDNNQLGALLGKTEKSYKGLTLGAVQLTFAVLFAREQEPNKPKNRLGPSICVVEFFCETIDGVTVMSATWVRRNGLGASKVENKDINTDVKISNGKKQRTPAFGRTEGISSYNELPEKKCPARTKKGKTGGFFRSGSPSGCPAWLIAQPTSDWLMLFEPL
jgi:hypothetical protein